MHDLIIIGAGPGGIALGAEAQASGINPSEILILEKAAKHNFLTGRVSRDLYPGVLTSASH